MYHNSNYDISYYYESNIIVTIMKIRKSQENQLKRRKIYIGTLSEQLIMFI